MNLNKVNRVEFIDHRPGEDGDIPGRKLVIRSDNIKVEALLQDDDRTLKIFISEKKT